MDMKRSTQYHYRFRNTGTKEDTVIGIGAWPDIAKALLPWLDQVHMNGRLVIEVQRADFDETKEKQAMEEVDAIYASLMADLSDSPKGEE